MAPVLWMQWFLETIFTAVRVLLLALATPLLEKNATKTLAARSLNVPVVFSMARLIVLAFAIAIFHQAWRAGIAGWPEATLSIAIVLALPILGALERARPADAIAVAKALIGKFGIGSTRSGVGDLLGREPSTLDDHPSGSAKDAAVGNADNGDAQLDEAA